MSKQSKKRSRDDVMRDLQRANEEESGKFDQGTSSESGRPRSSSSSSNQPPQKKVKFAQPPSSDSDDNSDEGANETNAVMSNLTLETVEGDQTITWNAKETVFPEDDCRTAMETLLAPLSFDTFVKDMWEKQKPACIKANKDTAKGRTSLFGLTGPNDLLKAITAAAEDDGEESLPMRYRVNASVTRWDAEEDEVEDSTPGQPGEMDGSDINDALQGGFAVALFGMESFDAQLPALATAISQIDQFWRGEGSSTTQIDIVPPGIAPFGAYAHPRDRIIVQLQGKQRIQVFTPAQTSMGSDYQASPDNSASQIVNSFPLHSRGPHPLVVHRVDSLDIDPTPEGEEPQPVSVALDVMLSTGDVVYVPKHFIVFTEPASAGEANEDEDDPGSMSLSICLGNQPSPLKLAQQILSQTSNGVQKKLFRGSEVHAEAEKLLRNARNAFDSESILNHIEARSRYMAKNFDVRKWIHSRYGNGELERIVEEAGGLVKIRNFLPTPVAEAMSETLCHLNNDEWFATEARPDQTQNNIAHRFLSSKHFPNSDSIFQVFRSLLPDHESTFSAARYNKSDHIEPHDDRAYKTIDGEVYSRYIAVIYYLSKDWNEEDGGALVDLDAGMAKFVPEFNSMVAFIVPRWHQVEAVKTSSKARLSIFGWFLKPGKLYPLDLGDGEDEEEDDEGDDGDSIDQYGDGDGFGYPDDDDEDDDDDDDNALVPDAAKQRMMKMMAMMKKKKGQDDELSVD